MSLVGERRPYWVEGTVRKLYPLETGHIETEVLVVGGGITGLTAAMRLRQAGKRVTLIEMNRVGEATTGHSTGHLDTLSDFMLYGLQHDHGTETARAYVRAKQTAISHIETWDRELNLGSDFRRIEGWLYAEPDQDHRNLERELEAARELGLKVDRHDAAPLPFKTDLAMRVKHQGRFNPLRYVTKLAERFLEAGGVILEGVRMEGSPDESGARVTVDTNVGKVTCDAVCLAGHAPLKMGQTVVTKCRPYQSYVLGVRVDEPVPDALFWDMVEPYHYTRLAQSGDDTFLIVGGSDHATGAEFDTREADHDLEKYVRGRFVVRAITHRWSHEWWDNGDGLPYMGKAPGAERVFSSSGYSGEGLTFGTVGGLAMSDLVLGRPSEWAELFAPDRVSTTSAAVAYAHAGVDAVKSFVSDRLRKSEVSSIDEIEADQGAVLKINGEQVAVYRDEHGELHGRSAICRHQGCTVHWNSAEKTWDCPCHGGRYDAKGHVIMGPPRQDLPAVELTVERRA